MNTGELCSREVITALANEPLLEVAKRMRDHHVGSLVVVDGHTSRLHPIGMVTDRDIVIQVLAKASDELQKLEVGDVMTREVVSARSDESVEEAVSRMRQHGVRRLPIVDGSGVLVGILTLDDVLESMAEELRELAQVSQREQRHESEARS